MSEESSQPIAEPVVTEPIPEPVVDPIQEPVAEALIPPTESVSVEAPLEPTGFETSPASNPSSTAELTTGHIAVNAPEALESSTEAVEVVPVPLESTDLEANPDSNGMNVLKPLNKETAIPLEVTDMHPIGETLSSNGTGANPTSNGTGGMSVLRPLNKESAKQLSVRAHAAVTVKIRLRLEKIMGVMGRNKQSTINNEQVQLLLHVSDATAARYLGILVKEGRVVREGRGNATRYKKFSN